MDSDEKIEVHLTSAECPRCKADERQLTEWNDGMIVCTRCGHEDAAEEFYPTLKMKKEK